MSPDTRAIVLMLSTALAIPAEGLRQRYYYDPPGILSVCYGYTGRDINKTKTYTLNECRALLDKDMRRAISTVDACRPGLPANVLAAFSDAVYNLGPKIACDTTKSTAARFLAAKDYRAACDELPRWNRATVMGVSVPLGGLTTRREAEKQLCLSAL